MAITRLPSTDVQVLCLADAIIEPYEDAERRGHLRLGVDDVRWLRSRARLKYGPDVRVIDISIGGILVETDGHLRPDSNICVRARGGWAHPDAVARAGCRAASFARSCATGARVRSGARSRFPSC